MENFPSFFNEKLKEHGLTIQKLSELTGITVKHLESLSHGDFRKMPPAPYLHGYILKVGRVLNFDGKACWERLAESGMIKTSGPDDQLPQNRFSRKPIKKSAWLIVIIIIIIGYVVVRLPYIFGQPEIHILEPESLIRDSAMVSVLEDHVLIRGEVMNGNQVFVNNESVPLNDKGVFEKNISLQPDRPNTIELTAKKFLGRETTLTRKVFYELPSLPPLEPSTSTPQQ